MKKRTIKGMGGTTVTILEPENEADAKVLADRVRKGEVDGRVSHGDMREKG